MELQIFPPGGQIEGFLNRYQIWCDYEYHYHQRRHTTIKIGDVGIPSYHYTDILGINQCSSTIVFVDCLTEGWHSKDFFEQYRTDKTYVIFSNGNWDTTANILPYNYYVVHHNWFWAEMADIYLSPQRFCFYFDKTYRWDYPKELLFVSTIGNQRHERDYLIGALTSKLPAKNYILRYSGQDLGVSCTTDIIDVKPGEFDPYTDIIKEYYHNISQTLPINLYNQGYFNLVVESDLDYDNEFFLTEKTLKCLITGIPFIVAAPPKHLENLKKLGFTTFGDIWDEGYDNIKDFSTRMHAIVDLVNQLSKFNWGHHKEALQQKALHNRNNFMDCNKAFCQEFKQFEQIVLKLKDNI